jgi:hypothetical protein
MATGIYSWSQTAATNATADSTINYAEAQAPSTVNDSARAQMAVLAKWRDDISGVTTANAILTTAGTANVQTLATNGSIAALTNGWTVTFKVGAGLTNTSSVTLAVDSLAAKAIQQISGSALVGYELVAGAVYTVTYHQPADAWVLQSSPVVGRGASYTPAITGSVGNPTVSYTTQVGAGYKLGFLVHFHAAITINTISGGSGDARITLPYTVENTTAYNPIFPCVTTGILTATTAKVAVAPENVAYCRVFETGGNFVQISDLAAGDSIVITGHYLQDN